MKVTLKELKEARKEFNAYCAMVSPKNEKVILNLIDNEIERMIADGEIVQRAIDYFNDQIDYNNSIGDGKWVGAKRIVRFQRLAVVGIKALANQ